MAAPLPTQDILGLFKALKDDIQGNLLRPIGLSIKSTGTKSLALNEPVSAASGFWETPANVSSKPPRWIVQVTTDAGGVATARFALDQHGQPISMARTIGYINNRDGTCAVVALRAVIAVQPHGAGAWTFPQGWECLFVVAFSPSLHAGTSGDPLTDFNPGVGSVDFGGGPAKRTYSIALRAILKAPGATGNVPGLTYDDAATAVATLAGATPYDGNVPADRDLFSQNLAAVFATVAPTGPFVLPPDNNLVGVGAEIYSQIEAAINSGKRHVILYGPPGTGKTTLAEYLAAEISDHNGAGGSYTMLTASSSWSAQDLVGGYQPFGGGLIGFVPGALLRDFDKPAIIDELNRCPIDKVLGPLFSVLSGQASTLPCRVDVADAASPFHIVLPAPRAGMAVHEHAPGAAWRLICTLNTYDKTQLGQISYALSRRFAWIKVGAPTDIEGFVVAMAGRLGFAVPAPIHANPIAAMWAVVNAAREIGGAPIVDLLRTLTAIDSAIDHFANPVGARADIFLAAFRMCVLPLMDGLSPSVAADLASGIATAWALDAARADRLRLDCAEFSA